jgi:hypothetical protein
MEEITINNWKWHITEPELLEPWFADFKAELSGLSTSRRGDSTQKETHINPLRGVKGNLERDVFRFEYKGRGYFAKYAHPVSLFQRVRSTLFPKLSAEFESIRLLEKLGVPVVNAVGWGSCGSESMLITEELRNSQSVRDYWFSEAVKDDKLRVAFLANFADFLKAFFDAGIYHPDFHPGNIMIVRDSQKFVLVDPYGVVKKDKISESELFEMLCIIGAFRGEIHDSEGADFIEKVLGISSDRAESEWRRILEHEAEKSEKLWCKRSSRAFTDLRNSQVFVKDNCEVRIRKTIVRKFFINPDNLSELDDSTKYSFKELSGDEAEKEWLNSLYLQIHRIPHIYPVVWISKREGLDKLFFEKKVDTILSDDEIELRRSFLSGFPSSK